MRATEVEQFKVWLRPMGNSCKVKVDGSQNAEWLRGTLMAKALECSEAKQLAGTSYYVFFATFTSQITEFEFRTLSSHMSEAQLMLDPA